MRSKRGLRGRDAHASERHTEADGTLARAAHRATASASRSERRRRGHLCMRAAPITPEPQQKSSTRARERITA
eukprot:scaffold10283_cov31-Tisochrysis_lutea.AAC.2